VPKSERIMSTPSLDTLLQLYRIVWTMMNVAS
jgi:hypothetical protein